MSERKGDHDRKRTEEDDFDDAVMAADDTGMIRNEANIVEVETEEATDRK